MSVKRFCVVDICGTLFSEDTTLGLVRAHVARKGGALSRVFLYLLAAKFSPFYWTLAVIEKISGKHIFKHVIICFLSGSSKEEMALSAEQYLDYLIANKKQNQVWLRLQQCDDEVLVLASASIEPLVSALASRLGCAYIASQLQLKSGHYTGHLLLDVTGAKPDFLLSRIEGFSSENIATVVSDNFSDRGLLMLANKPVVILNRNKDRARWHQLDAEYLETWR